MRDEPTQSYYPAARVRLIVRFEDYGATNTPRPPAIPPQLRKGTKATKPVLQVATRPDGSLMLLGKGDDPDSVGSPLQQLKSSDDRTFAVDGIIPLAASLQMNGIRTADTLKVDILYRDLPFDPRVIRFCAIQYFHGTVSADDYSRGLNGEKRLQATPSGSLPLHVIPDESIDLYGRIRSNKRFEGWVDEWESDWTDADSPVIRLTCTDTTRLLLEQEAPPQLTITTKKPIDVAFAEYLSNFPQFRGISVRYAPALPSAQIPKVSDVGKKWRPELGPAPSGKSGGKLMVWDYLTDVAGSVGHVVRFDGTTVIIQRPRTLYDDSLPTREDDPFLPRQLPSGRRLTRRLFLYGRNIKSMSFKRQFTVHAPQNIEVRCYDTTRKTTVTARYPDAGNRQSKLIPGNAADQKWKVIEVRWPPDPNVLKLIAQGAYEQLSRQELVTRVVTKNLGSFGGQNLDPDALDCKVGDAIDVETYRDGTAAQSTLTEIEEKIRTNAEQFLRSIGIRDERLAKAYQEAISSIGLQTTFRVRTVTYEWDQDEGIQIDFELINYIEIRANTDSPELQITTETVAPRQVVDVVVDDQGAK